MFDDPFVFFALVIAIVALIFARKAMNQVAELRQHLEAIQTAPAAAAVPAPPQLTPIEAFEQTLPPASSAAAPTPPPIVPDVEFIAPAAVPDQAAGVAGEHLRRRCHSPIVASRKRSAPAGWCGSAG